MNAFLDSLGLFFQDMFTYAIVAVFLENTIFSRALGVSTALFSVRKKYNVFLFGMVMTGIIALSALITYFLYPLVNRLSFSYYVIPADYVAVISLVYVGALLITIRVARKRREEILSIIHVSAFNCAVLGALLLASNAADITLGGFLGFGIGTGLGFTLATFFVRLAYEQLSSRDVPASFRGFPITLIYIGIVSLALYGLIGHQLPF